MLWLYEKILTLLFPRACAGCKKPEQVLCHTCVHTIKKAVPPESPQDFALFLYNQPIIRTAVWQLKYFTQSELIKAVLQHNTAYISKTIATIRVLSNLVAPEIVFIPIPLSKQRHNQRGFNQSELLCRLLQNVTENSIVVSTILFKIKHTTPQATSTNKQSRLRNVAETMSASAHCQKDTVYIVIDDVYTTGATIQEAKRALSKAGARHLYSLSFAHGK